MAGISQNGRSSPVRIHVILVQPVRFQFFVAATVVKSPHVFIFVTNACVGVTPSGYVSLDHIDESGFVISPFPHFFDIPF